jgi:hypothetical protein
MAQGSGRRAQGATGHRRKDRRGVESLKQNKMEKEEATGGFYDDTFATPGEFDSEAVTDFDAEKEKFWKCPSCHQLVEMEFAVCWNCQTAMPEVVEHPVKEELIVQNASENKFNPVRNGLMLVVGGIVIGLLGMERDYFKHLHWGRFIIGGFAIITGIALIISGRSSKSKIKD